MNGSIHLDDFMKKPYIIVRYSNIDFVEEEVNELISKGYVPLGNLIMNKGESLTHFYQVMILKELN